MNPHNFYGTQLNAHTLAAMEDEPLMYQTGHTIQQLRTEHWLTCLRNTIKCVCLDQADIEYGIGVFFNNLSVPWRARGFPSANGSVQYTSMYGIMFLNIVVDMWGSFLIPMGAVKTIINTQQHQPFGAIYQSQLAPRPRTGFPVYHLPVSVVNLLQTLLDLGLDTVTYQLDQEVVTPKLHRFFGILGYGLVEQRSMFPNDRFLAQRLNIPQDSGEIVYVFVTPSVTFGAAIMASEIASVLDNYDLARVCIAQIRADHAKARILSGTSPKDVHEYQLPVVVANTMRAMLMVDTDTAHHRLSNPRATPELSRFFQILGFSLRDDYAKSHSHYFGECVDPYHGFYGNCVALYDSRGLCSGDVITDSDIHDVLRNHFSASIRASELRREHAKTHNPSTITLRDAPSECWGVYHPNKQYAYEYAKTLKKKNPELRIDLVDDDCRDDIVLEGNVLVLSTRTLPASLQERLQEYTILNLETGLRMVI